MHHNEQECLQTCEISYRVQDYALLNVNTAADIGFATRAFLKLSADFKSRLPHRWLANYTKTCQIPTASGTNYPSQREYQMLCGATWMYSCSEQFNVHLVAQHILKVTKNNISLVHNF